MVTPKGKIVYCKEQEEVSLFGWKQNLQLLVICDGAVYRCEIY